MTRLRARSKIFLDEAAKQKENFFDWKNFTEFLFYFIFSYKIIIDFD